MYHKNKVEFGPAKAANAGGVAVSGLEMAQNSARLSWGRDEVDEKLKGIMKAIFDASKGVRPLAARPGSRLDYGFYRSKGGMPFMLVCMSTACSWQQSLAGQGMHGVVAGILVCITSVCPIRFEICIALTWIALMFA